MQHRNQVKKDKLAQKGVKANRGAYSDTSSDDDYDYNNKASKNKQVPGNNDKKK